LKKIEDELFPLQTINEKEPIHLLQYYEDLFKLLDVKYIDHDYVIGKNSLLNLAEKG
jgi:hypothetical protein